MTVVPRRVRRGVERGRRLGWGATARHGAELLKDRFWLDQVHVWYRLPLSPPPVATQLPPSLELKLAREPDLDAYVALGQASKSATGERIARGAELWMVLHESGHAAFACWLFTGATPVSAAPNGWMRLPPSVVCLEDSVTSPAYRGRGIAPRAWSQLATRMGSQGYSDLITKVERENAPSRRAVIKAGFRGFAAMRFHRRPGAREVQLWADGTSLAAHLRASLIADAPERPTPADWGEGEPAL